MPAIQPLIIPRNAVQLFIPGPLGQLDCLRLDPPTAAIKGVAIIFHPDPKGGGTYTNKIVQTLAKVLNSKGYICYCPNLRGVGMSDGTHDYGMGEVNDALAIYEYITEEHPGLPLVLAGFSFGCAIASSLATKCPYRNLILIAPAVTRYKVYAPDTATTIVIHGFDDEVIALQDVFIWAKENKQSIICVPGTTHFFHGKLVELANILNGFDI
ncbi:MAG: alpha/beta hydrolase [Burkholderiales bacterium]|jgi:alpha/beta superfamily hydrolase|nr:alpha/beta hydrolase [Burkholderiales bacterium]